MAIRSALLFTATMLVADGGQVLAQEHIVKPGDHVRLIAPAAYNRKVNGELRPAQLEGEVHRIHDGNVLVTDKTGVTRGIPMSAVTSLEVASYSGSKAGKGAAVGGLAGLAIGLALGAASTSGDSGSGFVTIDPGAIIAASAGLGRTSRGLASGDRPWFRRTRIGELLDRPKRTCATSLRAPVLALGSTADLLSGV
jgi:hypothetical protein